MTPSEIKSRLKAKRFKQKDLVKRFNASPTAISFLINGKLKSPRLEKRLARALGVTIEELRREPQQVQQ